MKNIISNIKNDKKKKALFTLIISAFFLFTIDISLAVYSSNNEKTIANIVVNDLKFNLTTNNGSSDDRILHLSPNNTEEFNILVTNLNDMLTQYELTYEVCNNSSCSSIIEDNNDFEILVSKDSVDNIKGNIAPGLNNRKNIKIITNSNSSKDVYIKIGINAGYEWNDLELKDKITKVFDKNKEIEMLAYVDGILVDDFPTTCYYTTEIKFYNSSNVATTPSETEASMTCSKNIWTLKNNITTLPKKIIIKFEPLPPAQSFAQDSWETIAANVKDGNTSMYEVGDTKCVKVEGITPQIDTGCDDGEFAVRLVNKSTPSECNTPGFSQTACGFVIEFTSVIKKHNMNPAGEYKELNYATGWNIDGWPTTAMYKYINGIKNNITWDRTNTLFSKLDSNLQNVIIDTYTVSGHGSIRGEQNSESYDKLYLLSTKEVWGDCGDGTNGTANCYDTAINVTRQLDWYNADIKSGRTQVTTKNYGSTLINTPIKYYQAAQEYWLRSASSGTSNTFSVVFSNGSRNSYSAYYGVGIAPAFRIG